VKSSTECALFSASQIECCRLAVIPLVVDLLTVHVLLCDAAFYAVLLLGAWLIYPKQGYGRGHKQNLGNW